uniref:Dishevelled-binding antagonist of beta-catenin 1 n=1 Tax=Labrus bergylta TaxID=56723 RepID=A0A3Q3G1S9_9LABR|nr:dapper homolog 1 [Labrus bergylta]
MLQSGTARRDADASERLRAVRERLEATVSGLGELELLRQRQEELVRAALELREELEQEEEEEEEEEEERRREAQLSSEEKLLEENILLLRKQLNCLRRRDTGLISQLQELDRQISDLRLDTEPPHDPPETDSRPSSGFYELSDAASGSLSNSSNSVFSECFCSTADADGRLPSTDELVSCLDCDGLVGGLCDDSSICGTVRRSLSAPHPPTVDSISSVSSCDSQSKYHCDLVARNGCEVYRYPSPLHAVAVQSPVFLQKLCHGGLGIEEGALKSSVEGLKADCVLQSDPVSASSVPQSSSWPAPSSSSLTLSQKRLDGYIFSLLQRRALPVRTNRPRTSISTEPSKSVLRPVGLCGRQLSAPCSGGGTGTLRGSEHRPPWSAGGADGAFSSSSQRQWFTESKGEQETFYPDGNMMHNVFKFPHSDFSPLSNNIHPVCSVPEPDVNSSTNSLLRLRENRKYPPPSAASTATLPKDVRDLGCPKANSSPKKPPYFPPDQELLFKSPSTIRKKSATPKNSPTLVPTGHTESTEMSVTNKTGVGVSSHSLDEAGGRSRVVESRSPPTQQQDIKLCQGGDSDIRTVRVKSATLKTSQTTEHSERRGDRYHYRSSSKKSRLLEDGGPTHIRTSRRATGCTNRTSSSRVKRLPASIPEGRVLDQQTTSTLSSVRSGSSRHYHHGNHHHGSNRHHHGHHHHGHHHGRDQVAIVAKPKYKRTLPYDEAFRRAQRRKRKELLSRCAACRFLPSDGALSSPYAYTAGSDSEYSAECASLFHSTIVDTSEDERSNYTANRFGDSESSDDEYVEESTTASDTEESGGGGAGGGTGGLGRGWSQLEETEARATGKDMRSAHTKAFVKIKASQTLKKKILRFRSGSLKLMTTV